MVEFVDRKNNPKKPTPPTPASAADTGDASEKASARPEQRTAKLKAPKKKPGLKKADEATEGDAPAAEEPEAKKADLKPKPKCPECGESMEKDAVLCVKCGFDTREGAAQVTETETKSKGPVALLVFLAIVLGGGAAYYFMVMQKDTTEATTQPPAEVTKAQTSPEPEPLAIPETPPEATVAAVEEPPPEPEPIPEPEPEPEPIPEPVEVVEAEPAPSVAEIDPNAEVRANISSRLDAKQPAASVGDSVVLSAKDGKTYRGKILAMNNSELRLYYNGSEIELQVESLSTRSRSQVDPEFREQAIDLLVQKVLEREAK